MSSYVRMGKIGEEMLPALVGCTVVVCRQDPRSESKIAHLRRHIYGSDSTVECYPIACLTLHTRENASVDLKST